MKCFTEDEQLMIRTAISRHSDKHLIHELGIHTPPESIPVEHLKEV